MQSETVEGEMPATKQERGSHTINNGRPSSSSRAEEEVDDVGGRRKKKEKRRPNIHGERESNKRKNQVGRGDAREESWQ